MIHGKVEEKRSELRPDSTYDRQYRYRKKIRYVTLTTNKITKGKKKESRIYRKIWTQKKEHLLSVVLYRTYTGKIRKRFQLI